MQVNLLNTIVLTIAGSQADGLVDMLYNKKNMNEFLIAKKLKLTINQVRNILYKLADEGLVSFTRKKDTKKGGWYIYYWTLNLGKSLFRFKERLEHEIENLKNQISTKKSATFFSCKHCGLELTQENALLHDYTCPECGEALDIKETTVEVHALEKEIVKREQILAEVSQELGGVIDKEDKARVRKTKAELKKKKAERDVRRKKVAKEKAKLLKGKKGKKKKK
ncbi:MAG: hypothetical protein Q8L29_04565 [archaeon]|nr:hypothetical protein [archaeon]